MYYVKDFCNITGKSPSTIQRWLISGRIQGRKVLGVWVVTRSELERVCEELGVEPPPLKIPKKQNISIGRNGSKNFSYKLEDAKTYLYIPVGGKFGDAELRERKR